MDRILWLLVRRVPLMTRLARPFAAGVVMTVGMSNLAPIGRLFLTRFGQGIFE